jgi:hypothetical protein
MIAPDIQLPKATGALGSFLENGNEELVLKAATKGLGGHGLLQMGNRQSQQPITGSRLREGLEYSTVPI